jgi:hypothetical protein
LIARKEGDEETGEQSKRTRRSGNAADEAPLLADGGKDVVVVHRGRGQKSQFDLRIRRLETFARPAAGTDRDQRLIDRPGRALLVDVGIDERGDPLL